MWILKAIFMENEGAVSARMARGYGEIRKAECKRFGENGSIVKGLKTYFPYTSFSQRERNTLYIL